MFIYAIKIFNLRGQGEYCDDSPYPLNPNPSRYGGKATVNALTGNMLYCRILFAAFFLHNHNYVAKVLLTALN